MDETKAVPPPVVDQKLVNEAFKKVGRVLVPLNDAERRRVIDAMNALWPREA